MAYLFEVDKNRLILSEHAYLIYPFKDIIERDQATDPYINQAKKELKYIDFMASLKKTNPYINVIDTNERHRQVSREVFNDETYQPDQLVIRGVEYYIKFQSDYSLSVGFLMDSRKSVQKLRVFLRTVDLNARTNSGAAVYKPKDITGALKEVEQVDAQLTKMEKRVYDELEKANTGMKGRKVGSFENPIELTPPDEDE